MKTELKDRVLWFDGTSEVSAELVPELLMAGVPPEALVVPKPDDDVLQFNLLNDTQLASGKSGNAALSKTWQVPGRFMRQDLAELVAGKLQTFLDANPGLSEGTYLERVEYELNEIQRRGFEDFFKALAYVVQRLKETKTVFGVGRGSSCASLVLFLFDLHKVDPIEYGIPASEFFHD